MKTLYYGLIFNHKHYLRTFYVFYTQEYHLNDRVCLQESRPQWIWKFRIDKFYVLDESRVIGHAISVSPRYPRKSDFRQNSQNPPLRGGISKNSFSARPSIGPAAVRSGRRSVSVMSEWVYRIVSSDSFTSKLIDIMHCSVNNRGCLMRLAVTHGRLSL